jgi:hypothetical protein
MLLHFFEAFLGLFAARAASPPGRIRRSGNPNPHSFEAKLRQFPADEVMAGSLELVGLEDLRKALGSKWPSVAERAKDLAELELQMNLGASDIYRSYSETVFLVCFAGLDKAAADRRARHIASRIRASLIAHIPEIAEALKVEHFVAKVDRKALLEPGIPIGDTLMASLKKVRVEADLASREFKASLIRGAQIAFAPAWHTARRMAAFNKCLLDTGISGPALAHFSLLADKQQLDHALVELDLLLLTRSIEALHKAIAVKRTGMFFLVPVTFRTVSVATNLAKYTRLLAMAPENYRKFLVIEIAAVPAAVSPRRIAELTKAIRPFANGVSLELALDCRHLQQILEQRPWAVAVNLQNAAASRETGAQLKTIITAAKFVGVNGLAHGANSLTLAKLCLEAGFTYIDGTAVHPIVREPKRPSAHFPFQAAREEFGSSRPA